MGSKRKNQSGHVGASDTRVDAADKVRGRAKYTDDLDVPGCWHAKVVRSPVAHGRLRSLTRDSDFDWDRVTVVLPEDIPGKNIADLFIHDMPFIAFDEINYLGEPLALVAAPDRELAEEAARHFHADIEELPGIFHTEEIVDLYKKQDPSLQSLGAQTIVKGDIEKGFAGADMIITGEYRAGYQEQLYIEPQAMIAEMMDDGGVFIRGSLQCPYFINPELCLTLNLPPEKIRVKQEMTGGAFGGKEEYPTLIAGYCALLAMKSRHPVKIVFDRNEDILYTTKRHPSWGRLKTGLKKDGTITAIRAELLLNGGAYTTISRVVLARGILHAAMGYRCDNVFVDGRIFKTHTFPCGAFRGFGAPQATWAFESHIEELAKACGMLPHEFRLKNCLVEGDVTPTGMVLKNSVGSPAVLKQVLERSDFAKKLKKSSRGNPDHKKWYGIGLAFFAHGSGFTGDGEARFKAKGAVELDWIEPNHPGVNIRISSTEMGQGAFTIMDQIAADAISISLDDVCCPLPDTSLCPNSGPTVASRTTMVVGHTVHGAGLKLKAALEEFASQTVFNGGKVSLENGRFISDGEAVPFRQIAADYLDRHGRLRTEHQFTLPSDMKWSQEKFEGDAYPAFSWGCNAAEIEVDPLTFEIKLKKVTACFDVGRMINPLNCKAQVEGGLVQTIGYALMEKMGIRNGKYDADRMQTYIVPTMPDIPEFDISFVEFPYDFSPPGAKGIGEMPMDGLAPAIANAIENATGLRCSHIPIMPEDLFALHRAKNKVK